MPIARQMDQGPPVDYQELQVGPPPQLPLSTFVRRRRALARRLGAGHALVVATHPLHQYSNDVDFPFRPHSDFWYLTGFYEPGCVLVLEGGTGTTTLFLRDRKAKEEIWTGRRLGVRRAPETLEVDRALDVRELGTRLPGLLARHRVHAIARHDASVARRVARAAGRRLVPDAGSDRPGGPARRAPPRRKVVHGRHLLHEMRLVKDRDELRLLKRACDLGVEAHVASAQHVREGRAEYQLEAAFLYAARTQGSNGVGYPSICGAGPNAAILHYITNRSRLRSRDLFLFDAGCEWGWYTSDITRTYPVGSAFTRAQSDVYEVVLRAQRKAMKLVRPGVRFKRIHDTAVDELVSGLLDLGYLSGSHETALEEKTYRRFFMHGTSHWLGLDVHDAGNRTGPDGKSRKLKEGMVLTVEPGLYFNPDFAECPPGTEGIGVRIEDDVAVGADGPVNLTRRLPVEPDAVAALVRGA